MGKLSRSQKILAGKTVCVLLVRGQGADGAPVYAYVAVRADRLEDFVRAQSQGMFYPEQFGVIIESGAGEPPADVRERMERDYGFNHDRMLDVPDPQRAEDIAQDMLQAVSDSIAKDA